MAEIIGYDLESCKYKPKKCSNCSAIIKYTGKDLTYTGTGYGFDWYKLSCPACSTELEIVNDGDEYE